MPAALGNKLEELETCVQLQGYQLVGTMEMWWDGSHDQSAATEGYRLFRKELTWGWVRIKEETGQGGIVVGVCCRLPDQEEQVAEDLYRQVGAALCSQVLVLTGDFNCPESCWRDSTAGHKQSTRFLEIIIDDTC